MPYLAAVVLLSGAQNPLILGLVADTGAALGKTTSYVLGRLRYLAAGDAIFIIAAGYLAMRGGKSAWFFVSSPRL